MDILGGLGDLWNWLTTQQSPGGSAGGTPYLGAGSPTASTQSPVIGPLQGSPMLGGQPSQGGGLFGLLGGQQPALASYFQPQGGGLLGFGNTPLGGMIRGGLEGVATAAGTGGLTGVGTAAMGAGQAELQRQQNQMRTIMAGQQYQAGQQTQAENLIKMQQLVQQINVGRYLRGLPDVTLNDVLLHPELISQSGLSTATAAPVATTQPSTTTTANPPIVPTAPITNPQVTAAYGGLGSGGITDPSRGSSWGAPPGVSDPAMGGFTPGAPAPIVSQQLPTVVPASGFRPPLALGGSPPSTPPPSPPSVVQPQLTGTAATRAAVSAAGQQTKAQGPVGTIGAPAQTTMAPPATTTAQPQQTTAQPSQAGGGTFTMPRTIQELENSNLPDWAKSRMSAAFLQGAATNSYDPVIQEWDKVSTILMAPQQAAAVKQAEVLATENLRPEQRAALGDVQSKYMADPVVQSMQTAQSIYRSGFGAYQNEQKKPSTQNELDLINSALQMMDQKAQPLRVGSADSMRQAENLPDLLYKSFMKLSKGGTLLPDEANALMDIINRHYQADQAEYNVHVGNYRQQAEFATGSKPGTVPDALWRPDAPPPPPADIIKENPTTHERVKATQQWDGQEWVTTGWQPI